MEIKTSVFRQRSGPYKKTLKDGTVKQFKGKSYTKKLKDGTIKEYKGKSGWMYRLRYIDPQGKPITVERGPFDRKTDASTARDKHIRELKSSQGRSRDYERWTFSDLAEYCLSKKGMYAEGAIKSRSSVEAYIKNLKKYFGGFKISAIGRESIREYHRLRLKQTRPGKDGPQRIAVATANREVATLRAMLFYAIGEGWTSYNPFFKLKLISTKQEVKRNRTLHVDEERRLLAVCDGKFQSKPYERTRRGRKETLTRSFEFNRELKAMIILALDSGLRRGELFKLEWRDIDFDKYTIIVRAENAKTGEARAARLSADAKAELAALKAANAHRPFPFTDIKRSFNKAKLLAGISDLRFHDLRRTYVTRQLADGSPLAIVGKAVGHSQLQTTLKHYTVAEDVSLDQMLERTNAMNVINRAPVSDISTESEAVN